MTIFILQPEALSGLVPRTAGYSVAKQALAWVRVRVRVRVRAKVRVGLGLGLGLGLGGNPNER